MATAASARPSSSAAAARFDALDRHHRGSLDAGDFAASPAWQARPSAAWRALLERADRNDDGVLDAAEARAARERLFARPDRNGDGGEHGEWARPAAPDGVRPRRPPREQRLQALDTDHDGRVSRAEFLTAADARSRRRTAITTAASVRRNCSTRRTGQRAAIAWPRLGGAPGQRSRWPCQSRGSTWQRRGNASPAATATVTACWTAAKADHSRTERGHGRATRPVPRCRAADAPTGPARLAPDRRAATPQAAFAAQHYILRAACCVRRRVRGRGPSTQSGSNNRQSCSRDLAIPDEVRPVDPVAAGQHRRNRDDLLIIWGVN